MWIKNISFFRLLIIFKTLPGMLSGNSTRKLYLPYLCIAPWRNTRFTPKTELPARASLHASSRLYCQSSNIGNKPWRSFRESAFWCSASPLYVSKTRKSSPTASRIRSGRMNRVPSEKRARVFHSRSVSLARRHRVTMAFFADLRRRLWCKSIKSDGCRVFSLFRRQTGLRKRISAREQSLLSNFIARH